MTTLEQVKTYVQNHLVAVVATSVVALVAFPTVATTLYQTIKNEHQDDFLSYFNLRSYERIKKLFGSKEGEISDEKSENNGDGEEQVNENQMQQPPVDEAKDQH